MTRNPGASTELRVVSVVLQVVAAAALLASTWLDGPDRVAAVLLVLVTGGAAAQLLWQHDRPAAR